MKIVKCMALSIVIVVMLFACKKTNNENIIAAEIDKGYILKNGVVTFISVKDYTIFTENKNNEWSNLVNLKSASGFVSLGSIKSFNNTENNNRVFSATTPIVAKFDSSLYSNYLLSILNSDKIVSINGYFVKIDMDNIFCSFIDQSITNAYAKLNTNDFADTTNIHIFQHVDEPIAEVLTQMRNGQITWAGYQLELARKGGQGICFRSGAEGKSEVKRIPLNPATKFELYARAKYGSYFLHKELIFATHFNTFGGATYYKNNFRYTTACNNSYSGAQTRWTYNLGNNYDEKWIVIYSGGTAIKNFYVSVTAKVHPIFIVYNPDEVNVVLQN